MKNLIVQYLIKRLLETSTLRGLILLVGTVVGYHFSDAQTNNLIYIVLGIVGVIGSFLPDNLNKVITHSVSDSASGVVPASPETTQPDNTSEPEAGWGDK